MGNFVIHHTNTYDETQLTCSKANRKLTVLNSAVVYLRFQPTFSSQLLNESTPSPADQKTEHHESAATLVIDLPP